jgi:hypothetical protein
VPPALDSVARDRDARSNADAPIHLAAFVEWSARDIMREADRCEALIHANLASEREYAIFISATRELARRSPPDSATRASDPSWHQRG